MSKTGRSSLILPCVGICINYVPKLQYGYLYSTVLCVSGSPWLAVCGGQRAPLLCPSAIEKVTDEKPGGLSKDEAG